jgi:hypothetical protein
MNSKDTAAALADSMQLVGMSYYFAPSTSELAPNYGINVYEFYGLGRGGVLGNVSAQQVCDVFAFFHENAINFLWTGGLAKADPITVAGEHIKAAYVFADLTFGAVDTTLLKEFAAAAFKVLDGVPSGLYPLVDGYKQFEHPSNPVHAAMLASILLRELRGGVHTEAVREVGLAFKDACYLSNASIFKLHGYSDEDAPEVTDELQALKVEAEVITAQNIEPFFEVLSDQERETLATGAAALNEAISNPVAV